jgi:hypothetical protein
MEAKERTLREYSQDVYKQKKPRSTQIELLASSISIPIENSSWGISSTAVASTQERDIRKVAINSELHGI